VRHGRVGELPACGDEQVELVDLAVARVQAPAIGLGVEAGVGDRGAEPEVRRQAVLAGAVAQVGEDLGLLGEPARPVGLGLERVGVQVGGRVAGGAGVGVVAPDAARPVRPVEDRDVLEAGLLQGDGQPDPAEPAADDGDRDRAAPGPGPATGLRFSDTHVG
jgi:hypothetical protein